MSLLDAFDADVLIYAARNLPAGDPVQRHIAQLRKVAPHRPIGVGSVLLVAELLIKPMRQGDDAELAALAAILGGVELYPCDLATAELGAELGATYGLKTADAVHLATAVMAGADRFITNNRKDFTKHITEVDVTYPEDLATTDS